MLDLKAVDREFLHKFFERVDSGQKFIGAIVDRSSAAESEVYKVDDLTYDICVQLRAKR